MLRCEQSYSEWFDVKCSILAGHSGGDRNQTSEEFNASESSLTESYDMKWNAYEYTAWCQNIAL